MSHRRIELSRIKRETGCLVCWLFGPEEVRFDPIWISYKPNEHVNEVLVTDEDSYLWIVSSFGVRPFSRDRILDIKRQGDSLAIAYTHDVRRNGTIESEESVNIHVAWPLYEIHRTLPIEGRVRIMEFSPDGRSVNVLTEKKGKDSLQENINLSLF